MTEIDSAEWDFRIRRYRQIRDQFKERLPKELSDAAQQRGEGRRELEEILDDFRSSGDLNELKLRIDSWSRGKPRYGFAGPNGAMFLNQLVNDSPADAILDILTRALVLPESDAMAEQLMTDLESHVVEIRAAGSSAAPGRVAGFLSWFWWLHAPEEWPVVWSSARTALEHFGFLRGEQSAWRGYELYREHVRRFGDFAEVEQVLQYVEETGHYGLDASVLDRLEQVKRAPGLDSDRAQYALNKESLEVLKESSKVLARILEPGLAEIFGKSVKRQTANIYWIPSKKYLRGNFKIIWTPNTEMLSPSLALAAEDGTVKIGMYGSSNLKGAKGFSRRTMDLLSGDEPDDLEWIIWGTGGKVYEPSDRPNSSLLGRSFSLDELNTHEQLEDAIFRTAKLLKPAFEKVWANESRIVSANEDPTPISADQELHSLVETFKVETGYPSASDNKDRAAQVEWATMLAPSRLASTPFAELRRIYNGGTYGKPGPQSILNTTLSDEDPVVVDRFLAALNYLLWGLDADFAERIDRVMDEQDLGLRGFKESVIMKFLAVAHPDKFLPVYPFIGEKGKAAMLQLLGRSVPSMSETVGRRNMDATAELKAVVEPLLPGDSWGQSRFLYWLVERAEESDSVLIESNEDIDEPDYLGDAADDLNLPREFLEEVTQLLENQRQVIFYGPPGTGKTFVAQRLVEALVSGDERSMLVQFHPSTSYEDFFEGYRPITSSDDRIAYKLISGPLRIMADRAEADPLHRPHILVIDEINRANLAKVLGELLFLLEYRDKEIRPLYRPEEPFSLPKNLWIIGTMNTADRSIATVDAALRRRFHFVPFIPDDREDNPISGLLARWLDDNSQPSWVADLVDGVNQRLRKELGGDHLLLGPSYFMVNGIDREKLAQIWKYRIEPLVDDLFFGDDKAKDFRFDKIWKQYGPQPDSVL